MNKREWVEREYEKWFTNFEIPFEKQSDVKMMLSLQYQFDQLPSDHTKAKKDIVEMLSILKKDLNLKQKSQPKFETIIVVNSESEVKNYVDKLKDGFGFHTHVESESKEITVVVAMGVRYSIIKKNEQKLRGRRCDLLLDSTNSREVKSWVSVVSKFKKQ